LEEAATVVWSYAEKGRGAIRIEQGYYGSVHHHRGGHDEENLAIGYCYDQMHMESEKVLVVHLASRGDECQLMCGVEKGSWVEMIQWREDVALVAAEVVAEGDLEYGRRMVSSCCYYRYQLSHSVEEIWRDEEHVAAGKEYVIPSKGMVAMAVVDHLQAFDGVREGVRCPGDWRNTVAGLLLSWS
jgi:hypothetical protein